MKLLLAALAVTFAVAIAATVVATWASVTDAPWEDDVPVAAQPLDRTNEIRCEGALAYRDTRLQVYTGLPSRLPDFLVDAEREIARYC